MNKNYPPKKTVMITGATGAMGSETVSEFMKHLDSFNLRLLVRPSKKNKRKMKRFSGISSVEIIWGDLTKIDDVARAMGDSDYVLHIGGMVSPLADHYPQKTLKVNTEAAQNIATAAINLQKQKEVKVVYIGSVAETSCRPEPHHWGRTGDPVLCSPFDYYGLSKILAERIIAESGLKYWVSIRQSGILHKGLVNKGSDPITFHVPLRGVLEWSTVEDSARAMVNICKETIPESFWRGFYNLGSGEEFRLSNYKFEVLLMKTLKCPAPEKIFEPGWFATRNFHGTWYEDSDYLDEILHFRQQMGVEDYFNHLARKMPWWVRLSPLAPAWLIKSGMKKVAKIKGLGTLDWLNRTDCEDKIKAFFGSREEQKKIGGWAEQDLSEPSKEPLRLYHGYDETKPDSSLKLNDMQQAAEFRGGKCLSNYMEPGDFDTPLEWECCFGHKFSASPRLILKGGHWCPDCLPAPWRYDAEAKKNKFLAQVWYDSHSPEENETYE